MRALIVVDMQNDFVTGSLAVDGAPTLVGEIKRLLDNNDYDHIVATQDWHIDAPGHWAQWGEHCKAHTEGAHLVDGLDSSIEFVVKKGHYGEGYSGFSGSGVNGVTLDDLFAQWKITDVDVVGLALDYCVAATALDAQKRGFTTRVPVRYTLPVTWVNGALAVKELVEAGVGVV